MVSSATGTMAWRCSSLVRGPSTNAIAGSEYKGALEHGLHRVLRVGPPPSEMEMMALFGVISRRLSL